jgi:hypothetical protein
VATTASLAVSMTDTEAELATYAFVPSPETATRVGLTPTGMVPTGVLVRVSIAVTRPAEVLAIYAIG